MPETRSKRRFLHGLVLALAPLLMASDQKFTPSALERDPDGWTDLLRGVGPDLEGWVRGSIPPGREVAEESQWSLDPATGHLVCGGDKGHEWLRLDQVLVDFVFHVEWRFSRAEGKKGYNSGIYVRNTSDAKYWHQAQTGDGSGGYLFGETLADYAVKPFNLSKDVKDKRVKPAGEWNTYEITCKGRNLSLWVNGAVTNDWRGCGVPRGYIGLEAEGWRIEFRNLKLKSL